MNKVIPILHNVRSLHNVGAILRTADGLGLDEVWVSGYTPYPAIEDDDRLPHVVKRATTQIAKTALGAEMVINVKHFESIDDALLFAKSKKYRILALEQSPQSRDLTKFELDGDCILLLGNEVDGLSVDTLAKVDTVLEISMHGTKESFNVSVASAIALFSLLNK